MNKYHEALNYEANLVLEYNKKYKLDQKVIDDFIKADSTLHELINYTIDLENKYDNLLNSVKNALEGKELDRRLLPSNEND